MVLAALAIGLAVAAVLLGAAHVADGANAEDNRLRLQAVADNKQTHTVLAASSSPGLASWLALAGSAIAAVGLAFVATRRDDSASASAEVPPVPTAAPLTCPTDDGGRRRLVTAVASVLDQVPAPVAHQLSGALVKAGSEVRTPESGAAFDPSWQTALGTEPAADGVAAGVIVRVLSSAVVDGGDVVRPAEVVVTGGSR
jgi:hypothetical protein